MMVKGFMGKTHALLSIMLLCICMCIPIDIFENTIGLLKENMLFLFVGIIVLAGGALLPDLDNCASSAGSTLGFMGSIMTIFMQSISSIIWTLVHTRRERHPITPHRYFWHTLVASIGLICLFMFGIPTEDTTIFNSISSETLIGFLQNHATVVFLIVIIFMAVLCGSDMILNRLIKLFKLPPLLSYVLPLIIMIYSCTLDFAHLRVLGICVGFGYLFHCLEDFFADTGVPLLWPIPIRGQCWHRCRFILTCETGGLINNIIDIVALAIDILLLILLVMKGI